MKDLSNDVVVQVNKEDMSYLQFKVLNKLGIKNAYSLNVGDWNFRHSKLEDEKAAYKKLCEYIKLDSTKVSKPYQRHTNKVITIDEAKTGEEIGEIDGLVTNKNNIVLATTNADCILYLLFDKKKKVIGNIHSGWRGSYQRIIEKGINLMINEHGSKAEDIIVCICPSIRMCCFEVDEDVKEMFEKKFGFISNINKFIRKGKKEGKYYIDTVGINNELLKNLGILEENIYDSNICSVTHSDLIHSYRAEGKGFKLATAIISLD